MSRAAVALLVLLVGAGCVERDMGQFALDALSPHDCGEGYIAFVRDGSIHRMRADGTDLVRLTNDQAGHDSSPRWSPDGRQIAFLRGGHLRIMDADGGIQEMAAETALESRVFDRLTWSPDGRYVAATTFSEPITVYDVATGSITLAGQSVGSAAWSPDSEVLLYSGGQEEVRVVRRDGTGDTRLFQVEGVIFDVAWSPDPGHYLAVIRAHNYFDNLGVDILSPNGARLGFVPFGGTRFRRGYFHLFWSPDSGCLGVTHVEGTTIRDLATGVERTFPGEMGDWVRSIGGGLDMPVASFTATPATATIGELVTFDASQSSDDFQIVEYAWDLLGDGTFDIVETRPVTEMAYGVPGSYDVTLRVRDGAGNEAKTTRTMTVNDASTVTLTIEFGGGASGSVRVYVDGSEIAPCTTTCEIRTPVGAKVKLVPDGAIDAWSGCDEDFGALGCELTMDADRRVLAFVEPGS